MVKLFSIIFIFIAFTALAQQEPSAAQISTLKAMVRALTGEELALIIIIILALLRFAKARAKKRHNSLKTIAKAAASKIELPYGIEVTATKNEPEPIITVTVEGIPSNSDLENLSKKELDVAISALQKLSKSKES
jgi:flagellar biogenesis protein FliO